MSLDLVRIDTRHISTTSGNHSAFLVVRNEASRLLYHLEYHRSLGVDRFFFVDNGSEDGTLDLLLSQPDCHVFRTMSSFAKANYGMDWINTLVERFGIGNWCLFLDADELFTYPHAEAVRLPEFCRFLNQTGSEGVFALLLDMYSLGPISEAKYISGTPFLETCCYFDRDYIFRPRPGLPLKRRDLMAAEAFGGPRLRRFYSEFRNMGPWGMTFQRILRRLRRNRLGSALGLHRTHLGRAMPPDLTKIPLLKGRTGRHWVSNHRCTPLALSEVTGSLLHFKFFSDFHERSMSEAARGQHWDKGAEYVRYATLLAREPNLSLLYEGSYAYRSTRDLLRLGLMTSNPEFDGYAKLMRSMNVQRPTVQLGAPAQEARLGEGPKASLMRRMGEVVPFRKRAQT